MARTPVNGAQLAIAKTYGNAFNITAASNASECVATAAAGHSVVANDIVEFTTSGWPQANGKIFRIKTVSTNDLTLEGFNTTSTTLFPAGSGAGTMRRITAWDAIGQVLSFSGSGDEQQFLNYQYLSDDFESQDPTYRSASSFSIEIHDDIAAASNATIQASQASASYAALRLVFKNGRKLYANGIWTMGSLPMIESNNVLRRSITVSALAGSPKTTEYAT